MIIVIYFFRRYIKKKLLSKNHFLLLFLLKCRTGRKCVRHLDFDCLLWNSTLIFNIKKYLKINNELNQDNWYIILVVKDFSHL